MVATPAESPTRRRGLAALKVSGLVWAFVLLCVVAAFISPNFLNSFNLINVIRQVALFGLVSIGLTFVILTRGIDLSVGAIVGVVAVSTALLLVQGVPIAVTIPLALVIGGLLGAVNGCGIVLGGMPPFIMTLGLMVMARGLAMTLANGQPISLGPAAAGFAWLGAGSFLRVPVPVWVFAVVSAFGFVVLRYTTFGRNVYAVGSNTEAARLSGIPVNWTFFAVYVISGILSGLTGLIYVSRLTVGEPTAGTGLELEAIAIAVIGGTSLFGGEGGVVGTVIGAAILAVIANILNLTGVEPFTQQIVKGAIIIGAVLLEILRPRR
jgi:ribose/xylose/arabinose/galactoside ABC-type transport system permease subunit